MAAMQRQREAATSRTALDDAPFAQNTHADGALLAACILAVAPHALGGAVVCCDSRAAGEWWAEMFHSLLPASAPLRRIPGHISEERLLGGLDLTLTLSQQRAVSSRGLLAEAAGGCVVLSASTASNATYAHIARTLDCSHVRLERDGLSEIHGTDFATIVIQMSDDSPVAASVGDRLAFLFELSAGVLRTASLPYDRFDVARARALLPDVIADDHVLVSITQAAARLGINSLRPVLLALTTARVRAALDGRTTVALEDVTAASRLVLSPRAVGAFDSTPPEQTGDTAPDNHAPRSADGGVHAAETAVRPEPNAHENRHANSDQELTDILVRTAVAHAPAGLVATFAARAQLSRGQNGRAGNETIVGNRGRQTGVRRGKPVGGARLDVVATLRAAIPLQRLRKQLRSDESSRRVELRPDDFRIRRCSTPATTTAVYVVDTSGSAAIERLAEAKGAVEFMLAEGYSRRDRAALITFRGTTAELVLPPTHALARARRAIGGCMAGGGTPLATALEFTTEVLKRFKRSGGRFVTIIITDGRANVGRDGRAGREQAMEDAMRAADGLAAACRNVLWMDTAARSESSSKLLATRSNARYLHLPLRNSRTLGHGIHNAFAEVAR